MASAESRTIFKRRDLFTHFKGALAEQYACQQLALECGPTPFFWPSEKNTSEIDFLFQRDGKVVPP